MARMHAKLRVPLKDHEAALELIGGSRPISLVIDGKSYFMTLEGAQTFQKKFGLIVEMADDDHADR
ncbi:MAG: hypothetical protein AAF608_05200 [Pseudomonadota bacterium]